MRTRIVRCNNLDHWVHEYPGEQVNTVIARITRWLKNYDGVHPLLADRSEVGWYGLPERESRHSTGVPYACEYTPEHVHHNWKFDNRAYVRSKEQRQVEAASTGQFAKGVSNPKYW